MAAAEKVVERVVKEGEEAAEDPEAHPQHRHSHQTL
jgi:hypothetical protein